MTLGQWVGQAVLELEAAGVTSARLEAQVLAAQVYGESRSWVIAHADTQILQTAGLNFLLSRRLNHEPLAYIVGHREFYGRSFTVDPSVLIPRQETETVVAEAISWIQPGTTVLDLGTGSGAIAITLALETTGTVWASDVSPAAVRTAALNAGLLDASVKCVLADMVRGFGQKTVDVLVSNPPYIGDSEPLVPEVAHFEPHLALYAGHSGLDLYKRLAKEAARVTKRILVLEVGDGMAPKVINLFQLEGWHFVRSRRDILGHERVLAFGVPGTNPAAG